MLEKFLRILKNIGEVLLLNLKKVLHFLKFLIIDDNKGNGSDIVGTIKNIFVALIIALVIRSLLYEPFHIPSGSMKPGLKEGDFIFVSKYDFGYSKYSFPFAFIPFKNLSNTKYLLSLFNFSSYLLTFVSGIFSYSKTSST